MDLDDAVPIDIVRRSDLIDPIDDRRLRTLIAGGEWTRIAPGSFTATPAWHAMTHRDQHRVRVLESLRRMRPGSTISHASAAALWGIDLLGVWPARVEVTIPRASGGRSSGLIVRHTATGGMPQSVAFGAHRVTTPAQTALDLARCLPHVKGVAAVDQALWNRRPGGALATRIDILSLWERALHRCNVRARRAIDFASPDAMNPRESQSRVLLAQLGFPTPRLQEHRILRTGREVFGDFSFPEHDHWAELDGRGKYLSPEFGAHRSPDQIVIDEKNRENEIRREVRGFSRWEPADLDQPRRLYDILTGDGLPSARPRP